MIGLLVVTVRTLPSMDDDVTQCSRPQTHVLRPALVRWNRNDVDDEYSLRNFRYETFAANFGVSGFDHPQSAAPNCPFTSPSTVLVTTTSPGEGMNVDYVTVREGGRRAEAWRGSSEQVVTVRSSNRDGEGSPGSPPSTTTRGEGQQSEEPRRHPQERFYALTSNYFS